MKAPNLTTSISATTLLGMALLLSACGSDRGVAPESDAFSELRFHEVEGAAGGDFQDLSIDAAGQMVLTVGRGDGQSVRGLLAGEKLETLARLINALPPDSYAPAAGCTASFFLSVRTADGERNFASGACDAAAPEALTLLRAHLTSVVTEVREPRVQPVAYRVILSGKQSSIRGAERDVIRSQDQLIALLGRHSSRGNVAVPRVDFGREMVIAEFLGDRTGQDASLSVLGIEQTEDGWLRVRWNESSKGAECGDPVTVQPFVLVAIPRQAGDLLFSTEHVVLACR
ncbi:MAG: hypothetical protein U0527_14215 [Candidatus Eisenbacteria bacterium]